ncbi:hypothetical protein EYF80_039781 [Liparis tanakae]|uniref:Uncharacterized protein n=1 Tax=Liparis tanakae TaxID=230148 RepID=A0A4Z2GA04_9TELE|nr:hypothetical protein EYF80_039781 [Liparis tanakae]
MSALVLLDGSQRGEAAAGRQVPLVLLPQPAVLRAQLGHLLLQLLDPAPLRPQQLLLGPDDPVELLQVLHSPVRVPGVAFHVAPGEEEREVVVIGARAAVSHHRRVARKAGSVDVRVRRNTQNVTDSAPWRGAVARARPRGSLSVRSGPLAARHCSRRLAFGSRRLTFGSTLLAARTQRLNALCSEGFTSPGGCGTPEGTTGAN